jgi:hypothetical protein
MVSQTTSSQRIASPNRVTMKKGGRAGKGGMRGAELGIFVTEGNEGGMGRILQPSNGVTKGNVQWSNDQGPRKTQ